MRVVALLAFAIMTPALTVRAGEPPALSIDRSFPDARAQADELIRGGVELRKEGREREALERFREAYALHPSPHALGQMGLAAKSLKRYVEAERHLEAALAADDPWVHQNRAALELARDIAAKHVASLVVLGDVPGAELLLNGTAVAKLPLTGPLRVEAGVIQVELRAAGYAPASSNETLLAGQTTEVRLALRPLTAEPRAMAALSPVPTRRAPPPADVRASLGPWIIVAAGVAVAGIGVGSYFGLKALSFKDERDESCPTPSGSEAAESIGCGSKDAVNSDESARSSASASTAGFVVGGIGLTAAAILLGIELTSKKPTATVPRAAAGPTARGGLAGVAWRF